jgi:hypothetical protein
MYTIFLILNLVFNNYSVLFPEQNISKTDDDIIWVETLPPIIITKEYNQDQE